MKNSFDNKNSQNESLFEMKLLVYEEKKKSFGSLAKQTELDVNNDLSLV